jgi:hypothetical protein
MNKETGTIRTATHKTGQWEAWQDDKLERFRLAAYLNTVIATISQPFVINISAPYGTGKTFFLKNWQRQLKDEAYRVVYLNASETEISGDPVVALVSAIREQVIAGGPEVQGKAFEYLLEVASPYILRRKQSEGKDQRQYSGENIEHLHGHIPEAKERLARHERVMDSMRDFRSGLAHYFSQVAAIEPDPRRRKLILLIDELDRCRPAYLLELLETLRHLFLVPGVVAVLAADQQHLRQAVSGVYGGEAGGEGYLRKFIDWELVLPDPSYRTFARHLYETFRIADAGIFISGRDPFRGEDHLIEGFAFFADLCNLTLRQQHHCFTNINIAARGMGKDSQPFGFLLGALTALKMAYGQEIRKFCFGSRPATELIRDFELSGMEKISAHLRVGWHDFKPRFHAWFVTREEVEIMQAEKADIEKQFKAMIESRVMNSRELPLKNRLAYIEAVLKTYDSLHKDGPYKNLGVPAQIVYRDLERASFLREPNGEAK